MNRKQLILLLFFMAVIGAAGLVLLNRNKESWNASEGKMGQKVLPADFEPNAVAAIRLKGASELNIVRSNDVWRLPGYGNYPANFHLISDSMLKLKDLKIVQSDNVGASQRGRVNLDEPGTSSGGTLLEFKDAQGKVLASLLLGKMHIRQPGETPASPMSGVGSPDGRYVLSPADPGDVLLVSNTLAMFEPNPRQWLSQDFFKAEKIKSISLTSSNGAALWTLKRESESAPWVLQDKKPEEELNQRQVSSATERLALPHFSDVTMNLTPAETGLDKPDVVKVETFDHFTYTIKVGGAAPDGGRYLTVNVAAPEKLDDPKLQSKLQQEQALAPWVYVVNSWIVNTIDCERDHLLEHKDAEKPAEAAGQVQPNTSSAATGSAPADMAPLMIKKN